MKKRILSFFLAALMIVGCIGTFAIGASAADEMTLSVVAGKITGNKVNVTVRMENNPGMAGINFKLGFDKSVIKPVSYTSGLTEGFINSNLNDSKQDVSELDFVTYVFANSTNYSVKSGTLVTYTFEVLNSDGFTNLTLDVLSCADENKINVPTTVKNSYIGQLPLDDLTLSGETDVVYDGNAHGFTINGLGDGMKVEWTVNGKKVTACEFTDAGTYDVTAVVSKTGYQSTTLTATLTIAKAEAKLTGVELWSAVEGTDNILIKSTDAASAEANGKGYPVIFNDAKVVKDGETYKIIGVTVANKNVVLVDTTVVPNFVPAEKIVETIIDEADLKAPIVSPQANKLPVPAFDYPGYKLVPVIPEGGIKDAEGNVIVDEEGNIFNQKEAQNITVDYAVVDEETGAPALDSNGEEIVVTKNVEIPKKASGNDLAILLLYYHKKLTESQTQVEAVKADITAAEVPAGTKVALTTATEGAVIHYTTDGTTATVLSPVYTAPIEINEAVTINAIATKSGMKTSGMASFTYKVTENSITLKADAANIKYMDGRGDKFEPEAYATRYEVIKALANVFDIKTTNAPLVLTDVADEYVELVNLCTAAGIIKGYEDKTFRGDENITRAEVATMICNIMGLDVENAKDAGFSDVSGWATKYVNACANAKYVSGNGDGTFAPNNNIKRNELTVIINNITGAKDGTSCSYADVVEGTWYFPYVAAAAK